MADAISFPDDGLGPRCALIVINRGTTPTQLTHMVLYGYPSRWAAWRRRGATLSAVISAPTIPFQLDVNKTWMGFSLHNAESDDYRAKGLLYVGIISAHSDKNSLIKVPPKSEKKVPAKVAQGR
jgi:hypothetical protein